MSDELLSHPDRLLRCHLAEVNQAAHQILHRYPGPLFQSTGIDVHNILSVLSGWHDIGKGTSYFQDYIVNPEHFFQKAGKGQADPELKTHTPLGTLLALGLFLEEPQTSGLPTPLFARFDRIGNPRPP